MYLKYGKNDELEGVFDSLDEAVQIFYKVNKQHEQKFKQKKAVITSSVYQTKKRGSCAGWYKIKKIY